MAVRTSALRWLLAIPLALLVLYTLVCMGFYAAGARHLPDRLEPARWRATPELRAQLLQVEAGMAPGDTVPRLDPLTFVPRTAGEIRRHRPGTPHTGGHRLLSTAARALYFGRQMHVSDRSHHLPEIALRIRLSREWTTDDIGSRKASTDAAASASSRPPMPTSVARWHSSGHRKHWRWSRCSKARAGTTSTAIQNASGSVTPPWRRHWATVARTGRPMLHSHAWYLRHAPAFARKRPMTADLT